MIKGFYICLDNTALNYTLKKAKFLHAPCNAKYDIKGYDLTYGIFSQSGFVKYLKDIAKENKKLILIDECSVVK